MSYNGWSNLESWNVSLWIQNDENYHSTARLCDDYKQFVNIVPDKATPDGISFRDPLINIDEMDALINSII